MDKCINISEIMGCLIDQERWLGKAVQIIQGILEACSSRMSQIAERMSGLPATNYKVIQRFLAQVDVNGLLLRFFQEEAEFVIGDPTEIPRPQAKKTAYVGQLSDGQTLGYWMLLLATPFRGRAIPFHFITYSSRTIGAQANSRNQEHFRAFAEIKSLLGERPLVLDREFSYLELLQNLVVEKIHFVIRLKVGLPQVGISDAQGQALRLAPTYGQRVTPGMVQGTGPSQLDRIVARRVSDPSMGDDGFGTRRRAADLLETHENRGELSRLQNPAWPGSDHEQATIPYGANDRPHLISLCGGSLPGRGFAGCDLRKCSSSGDFFSVLACFFACFHHQSQVEAILWLICPPQTTPPHFSSGCVPTANPYRSSFRLSSPWQCPNSCLIFRNKCCFLISCYNKIYRLN